MTPTLLVTTLLGMALSAEPDSFRFTLTGGDADLVNALVSVEKAIVTRDDLRSVIVRSADGATLPAQLIKYVAAQPAGTTGTPSFRYDLVVLVPELAAGAKLPLTATFSADKPKGDGFAWEEDNGKSADLTLDGKPVLRYMHAAYEKPADLKNALSNPTLKVWHHVFDPATGTRLSNGPDGQYPHHRGLYFGFNRISYGDKKADVWHGRNGESQRHEKFLYSHAGPLLGRHAMKIDWCGTDGQPFAQENREVTAYQLPGGLLLELASQVTTELPKVRLDGDPQHAGVHFRANSDVEKTRAKTYFLRPDGKGEPGKERNWDPKSGKGPVNLPWNAMSFELDGRRYTALYLDHPSNPKEARGSERAYGRIGSYFEYDLTPKSPLNVRYRVWIQPGEMTVEECEAMSRAFVTPPEVTTSLK
jgi:hypothetical protein